MTAQGFTDRGSITPDNLVAGEFPCVQRTEAITSTTPLLRGTVLGRITDSGVYTLSTSKATDGSQTPVAILAEPIEVADTIQAVVYHSGEFNAKALTFGKGHSADTVWASWRSTGNNTLFLRNNQEI